MAELNKDVVTLAMTRNAKDFTDAINNILNKKAEDAMAGKVPEIANALFNNGYAPKSGDEQEFVKAHTVNVTDYPVGNEDGVPFVAKDVEHHPHGAVKEEVEQIEEKELTKPEMKKREEIVMALKRKMGSKTQAQKSKIYAIATAQAKKSA